MKNNSFIKIWNQSELDELRKCVIEELDYQISIKKISSYTEEIVNNTFTLTKTLLENEAKRKFATENDQKILKTLEIPYVNNSVDVSTLADILTDEDKLRDIVSKLRNKIFW